MANLSNINNNFIVTDVGTGQAIVGATNAVSGVTLTVGGSAYLGPIGTTDASTIPEMQTNAVLTLKPHNTNSTNMVFSRLTGGATMGVQTTNGPGTAAWHIALSPFLGNVGIGTGDTAPSRKLDVRDTSNSQATILAYNKGASFTGTVYEAITDRTASSAFNLMNLKSSTVSKFLVRGDGNVGIGTDSPSAKLTIDNGSASGGSLLKSSNSSYTAHFIANTGTGNAGVYYDAINGDFSGGDYGFIGQDNTGHMLYNIGTSSPASYHVFTGGNVGIGTTTPGNKLEVIGGEFRVSRAGATTDVKINNSTSGLLNSDLHLAVTSSGEGQVRMYGNYPLTFYTNNAERMRITSGGDFGFNETTITNPYGQTNFTDLNIDGVWGGVISFKLGGTEKGWIGQRNSGNSDMVVGASAGQDLNFNTDGNNTRMVITSGGEVGIGTTISYSRLDVNGVITNRTASQDPNFTVAVVGVGTLDGGSLQFTQGFGGASAAGDTVVFRYNATSWKSWSLDYTFASTNGLTKGTIAGYNNNSGGGSNGFVKDDRGLSVVGTNSGQHVIVTFTGSFGTHMMCDMRYSQGGGDGSPRADRASLTFNS
jgi:hypothetical protein